MERPILLFLLRLRQLHFMKTDVKKKGKMFIQGYRFILQLEP